MDVFGTIVTFDLRAVLDAGTRFAEALRLFELTSSLGSTESLVVAPAMQQPRGFNTEQLAWSDIGPGTVRLSVGIEDPEDLLGDLERALAML
jgi:cystathionine beta-lyase/cystathionine gamma-synthase